VTDTKALVIRKNAIESYKKSVALNPANSNAAEMIKKLEKEM
jgi:hypothetical protein